MIDHQFIWLNPGSYMGGKGVEGGGYTDQIWMDSLGMETCRMDLAFHCGVGG